MKKFALKSAVLAICALAAASAFAAKNLDAAVTANKYASQLVIDADAGTTLLDGTATDLVMTAVQGVTPGADVTTYVRVDLGAGAKFGGVPTLSIAASGGTGAGTGTVSSGGSGASYVVFALSPTTGGQSTQAAGVMTITPVGGVTVFGQSAVTAQVRVYETLTAAANPASSSALKDSTARSVISFASGLTATITKGALVADVNPATGAAYTKFTPVVTAGSSLGQVDFAAVAGVGDVSGDTVTAGNMLKNTNDITFAGDFSFLKGASEAYSDAAVKNRVFLNDADTCAGTDTVVTSKAVTATSATFTDIGDSALVATHYLCVKPEGTAVINAGSYTAAVNYEAETGYEFTDLAATAYGDITRNGTTLIAPMTNQPAGWYSRLVLTNSGSSPRTYAVTAIAEDGTTVSLTGDAASGTVAANKTLVVNLQLLTSTVGLSRYGVQVVVNGPASQISGAYQLVNSATGAITNTNLIQK